jgi:hypothetical protein
MPMIFTDNFTDEYGSTFTVRQAEGHENIQLLITYSDGSEPTSYGFTPAGFKTFCELINRANEGLS